MRFLTAQDKTRMLLVQEEPRGPSQIIEVPVTANGTGRVQFPDIGNLRNQSDQIIIIKQISLVTPSQLTNGPESGLAVSPLTEIVKCSVDLYSEQWIKGDNIPLAHMINVFTEGSGEPWNPKPMKLDSWMDLDWQKSFIVFSNGTVSAGAPYCFLFDVQYCKMIKDEMGNYREIVGPA